MNGELFKHRYDLVFLTGSPSLAKVVMAAQAKYRSVLMDARKLNTKIKNDRIRAIRREFADAKRTSK